MRQQQAIRQAALTRRREALMHELHEAAVVVAWQLRERATQISAVVRKKLQSVTADPHWKDRQEDVGQRQDVLEAQLRENHETTMKHVRQHYATVTDPRDHSFRLLHSTHAHLLRDVQRQENEIVVKKKQTKRLQDEIGSRHAKIVQLRRSLLKHKAQNKRWTIVQTGSNMMEHRLLLLKQRGTRVREAISNVQEEVHRLEGAVQRVLTVIRQVVTQQRREIKAELFKVQHAS